MCKECDDQRSAAARIRQRRDRISRLGRTARLQYHRDTLRREAQWKKKEDDLFIKTYLSSNESSVIEKFMRVTCAAIPVLGSGLVSSFRIAIVTALIASYQFLDDAGPFLVRIMNVGRSRRLVKPPPGQRLLRLAEILFSPKTVALTFSPLIADWQFEYFEAVAKKLARWRLRMISIRYYWYYAKACGLSKVGSLFKAIARP